MKGIVHVQSVFIVDVPIRALLGDRRLSGPLRPGPLSRSLLSILRFHFLDFRVGFGRDVTLAIEACHNDETEFDAQKTSTVTSQSLMNIQKRMGPVSVEYKLRKELESWKSWIVAIESGGWQRNGLRSVMDVLELELLAPKQPIRKIT